MKCPNCEKNTFDRVVLEEDLNALNCTDCGGHWINSFQYWMWQDRISEKLQETSGSGTIKANDIISTKKCPECGKSLQRYEVGHGTNFTIDRCENCRGIWFDKNEWEILKDKNLHDEIHFIFSNHWQADARKEKSEKNRENILEKLIGIEGLDKVKDFKAWYKNQSEKSAITAFLNN